MRSQEVEARVLAVVDRIMNGGRLEDSLIECKAEWPGVDKARQLAAHANSARGEEIVWIIGIDEKAHRIVSPTLADLANWWPEFSKRFDEVAPGIDDYVVSVGDSQTVTALIFSTDRAPYVVKTGAQDGRVEREIPIREGTRTRSARRHELLRLLHPASSVPDAMLLFAHLTAHALQQNSREAVRLELSFNIFIDQRTDEVVILPHHRMQSDIHSVGTEERDGRKIPIAIQADQYHYGHGSSTGYKGIGVFNRGDGLIIAGSSAASFRGKVLVSVRWRQALLRVNTFQLRSGLGVAGTERSIDIISNLRLEETHHDSSSLAEWTYYNWRDGDR